MIFLIKLNKHLFLWISERSAYGQLAMQGLSIFDKPQKNYLVIQKQWQPVLNMIVDDPKNWF